ncbi:MAG: OadG family protein [Candidatus Cloacimonetes bacterium]|nr:OadG family protein [Candidatus Cloacimonadota bacterium]
MKYKIFLTLVLLIIAGTLLMAKPTLNADMTIRQISETSKIPVRKVIEYLQLDNEVDVNTPLKELNINADDLQKMVAAYKSQQNKYYLGIVIVGMGTVFASLFLVALIIAQLRHLDKKKSLTQILPAFSSSGLQSDQEDDIVAAIITTIYLYELEVEESNKLLLTWRRAPLSMWKASNYIPMNEIDPSRRK